MSAANSRSSRRRRDSLVWLPLVILVSVFGSACSGQSESPEPAPQQVAEPNFSAVQAKMMGAGGTFSNAWADIDGDGDSDLFVGFNGAPNRLYRNDNGVLVNVSEELGITTPRRTRSAAWGDFDLDGDPDMFLGLTGGENEAITALLRNDGDRFVDVASDIGLRLEEGSTRQAAWVDFDGDGDLDLFLAMRDRENVLFRNDGGQFQDVAGAVGVADARRTVGALWFDYEQDGDLDLVVANMDGGANGLFRNHEGMFTDVAAEAGIADGGRGIGDESYGTVRPCVVDYDADGWMDLFMANYGPNALYHNEGNGQFRNVAGELGVAIDSHYDTCVFGDYDLDGRIDLFVNGTVAGDTQYRDYLLRNTEDGFVDVTPPELLTLNADHGAQWVDFDGDGALDLSLTGAPPAGMHYIMRNSRNDGESGASIQVLVVDAEGNATRAGAEVRVYRAGTNELLGAQVVDSGSGYNSQNVTPVHFGLPGHSRVDVEVVFPRRGRRDVTRETGVDPSSTAGNPLTIRTGG